MRKKLLVATILVSGIILTVFIKDTASFVTAASQSLATLIAGDSGSTAAKNEVLELNDKVQDHKKRIDEITTKIAE